MLFNEFQTKRSKKVLRAMMNLIDFFLILLPFLIFLNSINLIKPNKIPPNLLSFKIKVNIVGISVLRSISIEKKVKVLNGV